MGFKVLGSSGSFWTPKPEPPAQPFAGSKEPQEPDILQVPCAIHGAQIPALHLPPGGEGVINGVWWMDRAESCPRVPSPCQGYLCLQWP